MLKMMKKSLFFYMILIAASNGVALGQNQKKNIQDFNSPEPVELIFKDGLLCCDYDFDCNALLKVTSLCLKRLRSKCIESQQINIDNIFADGIKARLGCFEHAEVKQRLGANKIRAEEICTPYLSANRICANEAFIKNSQVCTKIKATAVFSVDTPYTLGTPVNFNTVLDDPNGNVSLAPFSYTAPVTGDYMLTLQINQEDLDGVATVLGQPVASLQILVNGVNTREVFFPYLSFHNQQKGTLSSLIGLHSGDVITAKYNIYVLDSNFGFSPYAGTVEISGSGTEVNESFFKIHYLSTDCLETDPNSPCNYVCAPYESICDQIVEIDCNNICY